MGPVKKIKKKISPPFVALRRWLEDQRRRDSRFFDAFTEGAPFVISFVGTFLPALFSSWWWLIITNFIVFGSIYILQWATLTNKTERLLHEEQQKYEDQLAKYRGRSAQETDKLYTEAVEGIDKWENLTHAVAGFSHSVADDVKKVSQALSDSVGKPMRKSIYSVLDDGVSDLESILTELYGRKIRASIKLVNDDDRNSFKTYARGKNNVDSRGGERKTQRLNKKALLVKKNYAYNAIINQDLMFFAEGNLHDMKNKYEESDEFYCEYPDYWNTFRASIVMPIRVPEYKNGEEKQVVSGIVCVDCREIFPEWSRDDIMETTGYLVIAGLADSLALLIKKYKESSTHERK
jgi:hypothetical protein